MLLNKIIAVTVLSCMWLTTPAEAYFAGVKNSLDIAVLE